MMSFEKIFGRKKKNNMKIRKYKKQDFQDFYKLYVFATQEENTNYWDSLGVKTSKQVENYIASQKWLNIILVEENNEIIGYAVVWDFIRSFETHIFLDDLFILPSHRSKWWWTMLIDFLKENYWTIYLFVDIHNEKALKFYKKNGAQFVEKSDDQNFTMKIL